MKRVAVLGEGVTAKAVCSSLEGLGYTNTSVDEADLVVASPGISPDQYPSCSAPIISEIEFAYLEMRERGNLPYLIVVTGTNGKSTVTAMIANLLGCSYAGNIGIPFIEFLDTKEKTLVLEVSSFQLERCFEFCPDIAVFLNLSSDHLSRHCTFEAYSLAKVRLFQQMGKQHTIIYNKEDAEVCSLVDKFSVPTVPFCLSSLRTTFKLQVPGRHNQLNAEAAIAVAKVCGVKESDWRPKLEAFIGLDHRLELVTERDGVRYINDSKATNLEATLHALEAFEEPKHVILCGQSKPELCDEELTLFLFKVLRKAVRVYVYGGLSERYQRLVADKHNVSFLNDLDAVIKLVYRYVSDGDVVLFSPSSSSYDLYESFEHRGDEFKKRVLM